MGFINRKDEERLVFNTYSMLPPRQGDLASSAECFTWSDSRYLEETWHP